MLRQTPIIVILGSTATGKTKLSIDLARRFAGEILSADSMQVYKNLDISTAKATQEERKQAVHHMLDVCDVKTKSYTIIDFRDEALPIINRLLSESKMPIIVGGTTYYIESLLWKVLIGSNGKNPNAQSQPHARNKETITENQLESNDPLYLHDLLTKFDPDTAQRLHPNNIRKVRRALEVFMNTGKSMSKILTEQQSEEGGSYLGGPLRFQHVILFWLKCDQTKLNKRIDHRIDSMIADGMLFEIRECYNILKCDGDIDATRGMMQAIGFKEFLPYLQQYQDETYDNEITEFIRTHGGLSGQKKFIIKNRISDALKLLENCLDVLRLHTQQYSKKQIKWIRHRLISNRREIVPDIYELDGTNAETNWHDDVYVKAERVVQAYIDNVGIDIRPAEKIEHPASDSNMNVTHFCDVCNRRFIGDREFNIHLNSGIHKKIKQKLNRKLEEKRKSWLTKQSRFSIFHRIFTYFNSLRLRIVSYFWRK